MREPIRGPVRLRSILFFDDAGKPAVSVDMDYGISIADGEEVSSIDITFQTREVAKQSKLQKRKGFFKKPDDQTES